MPASHLPSHTLKPVSFLLALFGEPLIVTLATFRVMLIPVAVKFFKRPFHFVNGTSFMLNQSHRYPCMPSKVGKLGRFAVLMIQPSICILALLK